MRSDTFDAVTKQFRRFRHDEESDYQQRQNYRAFCAVIRVYIFAIEHSAPYGSSAVLLDDTIRPLRWSPDLCHSLIDVENAVKKAIGHDTALLEKFGLWFIAPEIEPGIDPPILKAKDTKTYNSIVQKCGREFIRRGMFPTARWFGITQRIPEADLTEVENETDEQAT